VAGKEWAPYGRGESLPAAAPPAVIEQLAATRTLVGDYEEIFPGVRTTGRHPDAGARRHRGDKEHRRGRAAGRRPRRHPHALRVVMRGDALLSPAITRHLISEFVARPPDARAAAGMETLTNREREVVALAAHGLSNDEIAAAMVLSPAIAKTHVSRAMIKLAARDRA
jgi:DNA-binding CsgD family transcriptional regulator